MDPENPEPSEPEPAPNTIPTPALRRHSKIGRLPKKVRDSLNFMLLDGLPYSEILKILGEHAKGISENNITRWSATGYEDWLRELRRLDETRIKQEVAMDLACPDGGSKIHEATLQLAATRLSEMVRQLDCDDFKDLLRDDPAKLIPFLNALATISNAELKCERHRIELAEREAKLDSTNSSTKTVGLRVETRQQMEKELNLM